MRRAPAVVPVLFALLLASIGSPTEAQSVLGKGVTLEDSTPIAAILADPDAWIGKRVRIEGGVLDVCPMKGCWAQVGDDEASLRVKVEDDVIVFPADSTGRIAAAEGIVEAIERTREEQLAWLAHLAEERGEEFDPETAELGDGPYRTIQLRGDGARLE